MSTCPLTIAAFDAEFNYFKVYEAFRKTELFQQGNATTSTTRVCLKRRLSVFVCMQCMQRYTEAAYMIRSVLC